jgi:hypothetical protein
MYRCVKTIGVANARMAHYAHVQTDEEADE